MASKKVSLNLGLILTVCTIVLALVAFFMLFVTNVNYSVTVSGETSTTAFTGVQVAFGYSESTDVYVTTITTEVLKFSFMAFLPYLLVILAVVVAVASIFLPDLNKILKIVVAVLLLVAGILFFCMANFPAWTDDMKDANELLGDSLSISLGAGAIVAAILSLLGCGAAAADIVLSK